MTQRLIAAVSAPTAEGVLYELDLRLRPSGNKGPVATHIDAFRKYQREEAWTWEHMALTRARAIAGDAALCGEVEAEVAAVLALPRDAAKVLARGLRHARHDRDGKAAARPLGPQADPRRPDRSRIHRPGCGPHRRRSTPVPRVTGTAEILSRLAPDFADAQTRQELCDAYALYLAADAR